MSMDINFVDDADNVIGFGPKSEALQDGITHQIARIFIFNEKGEVLIQKRASHCAFPGCWDQSAAGHVDAGEDYDEAAYRELREELGITELPLVCIGKFYSEEHDDSRIVKRFNSVYFGKYTGQAIAFGDEVSEIAWVNMLELFNGANYTSGFSQCLNMFEIAIRDFSAKLY